MRFEHLTAPMALALLSAISSAQQAAKAPTEGLYRFRDALVHIKEHDASGYAVPDEEVARIEKEIEQVLHVPATWHVMLRNVSKYGADMNRRPTGFDAKFEEISAALKDRAGRQIRMSVTLDAQSVSIEGAGFVGPDGKTDFTVRQFREGAGFFPLRAIPIVLDRLESELDALPVEPSSVKYLGLESAQPLGESPYVRCVLSFEQITTSTKVTTNLNGIIALPASAAHEPDLKFVGDKGTGDSVIGPITSTRSLSQCFREARTMSDVLLSGGDWSVHVFHNNGRDNFPTFVHDPRNQRTKDHEDDFRIDSSGFVGDTDEISASIAGVPLSRAGLHAFLRRLSTAYDPKQSDIFVVIGCAERHEIDVVFTSGTAPLPIRADAPSLRVVFDASGSKIDHDDGVLVNWMVHQREGEHIRWTFRFADDRTADIWIHEAVFCAYGEDLTPRARIGDTPYEVAGGKVKSLLGN